MNSMTTLSIHHKQSGAALVVGLIVLLIMTMLGVASMGNMTTELRMAANVQNQNVAFQTGTAYFEMVKADPAIIWGDNANGQLGAAIATQPVAFTATAGVQAQAVITFTGCRTVTVGDTLTQESGGIPFYVHEIEATADALNSNGDVVSTSHQVLGLVTFRAAGC